MPKNLIQGRLAPELFNELLNGPLATRVDYLRADLCPCRAQRAPGNADPRCPVCSGLGYTWEDVTPKVTRDHLLTRAPLPGYQDRERLPDPEAVILRIVDDRGGEYPPENVTVDRSGTVIWAEDAAAPEPYSLYTVTTETATLRAGVMSVMARREYQVRGEYDVLDLSMTLDRHLSDGTTLNPAWDCGESDRFILLDTWRRHAQHVQRGQFGPDGDKTQYRHMRDLRVSGIVDGRRVVYAEGQDFTFADGVLTWQPARGPAQGATYAVQGQANPEYYVFKALPQLRHQDGAPLPRNIVLKGFESWPNRRPADAVGQRG